MNAKLSLLDRLIVEFDAAVRTVIPPENRVCGRSSPASSLSETVVNSKQRQEIAGLMRVNHSGEVCAQALYQGQAITAQNPLIALQMRQAAAEETDHLAWCEGRLRELGSHASLLNPFWYSGSLIIGLIAGLAGDRFSLGFLAETEVQVSRHLQQHLARIPTTDSKTRAVLAQMEADESEHAALAIQAGGGALHPMLKRLMTLSSKVMTTLSYYL